MISGEEYQACPQDLWEGLCAQDGSCTFYQTPDWLHLASSYLKSQMPGFHTAEVAPWLFDLPEGPAVLPLLRRKRFGAWHYFSPFGTYSAPVTPSVLSPESREKMRAGLRRVNLLLTSSPFTANAVQVGKPLEHVIQVVDLTSVDPDRPMRDWEEGQRRRHRVSQRSGVVVRRAEGEADWRRYFELYQESLQRWGEKATLAYGWDFFAAMRDRLQGRSCMQLWLAEIPSGSEAAVSGIGAGYLTFYHNRHVIPWHGAGSKAFFPFGVTQALFYHLIQDAARKGYAHFDLTGSSGLSGVEAFKSRFGTQEKKFQGSWNRVGLYGLLSRWRKV